MTTPSTTRATGAPLNRLDGVQKVTGAAKYSYEYLVAGVTYKRARGASTRPAIAGATSMDTPARPLCCRRRS